MKIQTIPTPKTVASNPELFARKFLKVLDKEKNFVPFKWNKVQRHFHERRTGRDLVLKARQLGFTTYIQGELFRRLVTSTRTAISLSNDDDNTSKLRLMADRFYDNCRFGNVQPERKYANAALTSYPEFDSAATIATAGSLHKGRGDTYTDFHGSEVAFWPDAEKIIAGAMQGGNPDAVLESTPNGAQGYFYERCMEAIRGEGVWTLHFYPWWWDEAYRLKLDEGEVIELSEEEQHLLDKYPQLTPEQFKWRRNKKKELRTFFTQEYPEDVITCFMVSGDGYFGDLSDVFTAPMEVQYNPEHSYYAGLDFGQTNDFTAMPVIDATTKQQVDLLHIRKLRWSTQRARIISTYNKWHCKKVGVEMNSIGSPNAEALREAGLRVVGFNTTNASKAEIMSDLYEGLHTDGLKLQDYPVQRQEMNSFVSSQTATNLWRLAASGDGHDDTVMSLGICWWAVNAPIPESLIDFA